MKNENKEESKLSAWFRKSFVQSLVLVVVLMIFVPLFTGAAEFCYGLFTGKEFSDRFETDLLIAIFVSVMINDPFEARRNCVSMRNLCARILGVFLCALVMLWLLQESMPKNNADADAGETLPTSNGSFEDVWIFFVVALPVFLILPAMLLWPAFQSTFAQHADAPLGERVKKSLLAAGNTLGPVLMFLALSLSVVLFFLLSPGLYVTLGVMNLVLLALVAEVLFGYDGRVPPIGDDMADYAPVETGRELLQRIGLILREGAASYVYLGGLVYLTIFPLEGAIDDIIGMAENPGRALLGIGILIVVPLVVVPLGVLIGALTSYACVYGIGSALKMPGYEIEDRLNKLSEMFLSGGIAHLFGGVGGQGTNDPKKK